MSPPSAEVFLMESEEEDQARPAPVDLDDPQAFYALFHGYSMVPTGIGPADFCLVSPCAKLEPGQRIWLRGRQGREGLRWLIRLTATTYEVAAWQPPRPNGHQDLVPERWERQDVADRGVIPGRVPRLARTIGPGAPASRPGIPGRPTSTSTSIRTDPPSS